MEDWDASGSALVVSKSASWVLDVFHNGFSRGSDTGCPESGKMRVVQLGCGITGLVCAEHVVRNDKVDELVLADSRPEAAKAMMTRVKNDKFSIAKVDARDRASIKKVLKGCDLIVSSIPSEMNIKVFEDVLAAGASYIDFSVAIEVLDDFGKYKKKCEKAGITAITGMGADPGITDIFARYAANKLDSCYEAHVRDGDNGSAEGVDFFTLWSPLDMMEEVEMKAAVYKNGKMTWLPPLSRKDHYDFPKPIGTLPVYNTTHEETFMIPMFIKGIKNADFKIAIDDNFASVSKMLRKIGMLGLETIDVKGVKIRPIDVVVALMPRPVDLVGKVKGTVGVVVEVLGKKDGKKAMARVWSLLSHEWAYKAFKSNATGYIVGTGGALGANLILSGEMDRTLYAPEQLPAEKCVSMLPGLGLTVEEEFLYL